ncbi:MAG: membrane protein insertion efficiency factor YidD [Pseudomonadota bacterium]
MIVWFLILPIRAYRLFLSPWVGHSCRFQPSCSAYAIEALQTHGPLRGLWFTLRRLVRCNPLGASGYDPVPDVGIKKKCACREGPSTTVNPTDPKSSC